MATYAEQLASVQEAISAIESGAQRVDHNGRLVQFADLTALYQREQWLRTMVARTSTSGIRIRGVTPV